MKASLKKLLIVGAVIFLVGLVVAFLGFRAMDFSFKPLETEHYTMKSVSSDEHFYHIDIRVSSADVIFVSSETGKTEITYPTSEYSDYDVSIADDKLTIEEKLIEHGFFSDFGIHLSNDEVVTVALPEKQYWNVTVETASGDIKVPNSFCFRAPFSITTSSGDVDFRASSTDEVNITTSSGNVLLGWELKKAIVTTSSGDVSMKQVKVSDLSVTTASGGVDLDNVDVFKSIVKTSSGDVRFRKLYGEDVRIETQSGDVSGNNEGYYDYIISTQSGSVSAPKSGQRKNFTITTSSGDIRVR